MISCIVTSYNKKEYLPQCLDSIIANTETYQNGLEIIIVDDKSNDGSLDIAKDYANRYPSLIRLIQNEENIGAGMSRDKGIKNAIGDWISLIDADDYIDNDFFKSLEDLAIQYNADMVYGTYKSFQEDNPERTYTPLLHHPNTLLDDMEDASLHMPEYQLQFLNVSLTKRALYEDVDYCPSRFIEDTPTALCLLTNAKRVYVSDYCGYNYRQLSDSLIHSASQIKHSVYLYYNMMWAVKFIETKNKTLAEELANNFKANIYSECCLYRINAKDFQELSEDMWKEIKEFYHISPKKMNERKTYAVTHMSKIIKLD